VDTFDAQWRIMVFNMARQRRKHSPEFKSEVVRLVLDGGQSAGAVAKAHDLADSLVAGWVKQAKIDRGSGPTGALTTTERQDLARLQRENRELRQERDFLKKCAAFFARQSP
jgi:transposase